MPIAGRRVGTEGLAAGVLVALLLSVPPVAAQTPPPAPWIHLTIAHVDPSMVEEYLALQREIAARVKRAGTPWRTVSRTEVFGDTYRFLIAYPVQNLAGFDSTRSDPDLAALNGRTQKYVRGQQSYAVRTIPEIDNPLPEKQAPTLMVVNVVKVVPGREQDYFELMKTEFLPHFDKEELHHLNGALAFGGEGGYIHLFHVGNFAKLDEGSPIVKALGPKGAQEVTAKLSGIVTSSELWIARLIPEASFGSWSAPPAKPSPE